MKFGDRLLSSQHPPWSGSYINYFRLKQLLNPLFDLEAPLENSGGGINLPHYVVEDPSPLHYEISTNNISTLHQEFTRVTSSHEFQEELNYEIRKALLFLMKSMGELASDLSELSEQQRFTSKNVKTLLDDQEKKIMAQDELQQQAVLQMQLQDICNLRMEYLVRVGSKLILLLHFVELNIEAIVKIVKKHDKILSKWEESHQSSEETSRYVRLRREYLPRFAVYSHEPNVRCLFLAAADAGDCRNTGNLQLPTRKHSNLEGKVGGWDAIQWNFEVALRELHQWQSDLERALEVTDDDVQDTPELHMLTPSKSFSEILLTPSMGSSIKRFLSTSSSILGLENKYNSQSTVDREASFFEPMIYQIQSSRQRMGQMHHRYIRMVYAHEMLHLIGEKNIHQEEDENYLMQSREEFGSLEKLERVRKQSIGSEGEGKALMRAYPTVSGLSKFLNLASAGLYMCNYNIVAPTSGLYAELLGFDRANAGIIIGMTPFAVILSAVLYSWWSSYSYKRALMFASCCCMLGNIVYALALPFDSLFMVLIGRMLTGFGSARVINRRYIADYYSIEERTLGMANFVSASAFGMALGPGLASALSFVAPSDLSNANSLWTIETAPGYVMFVLWAIYLVCNMMFFEEPERISHSATNASSRAQPTGGGSQDTKVAVSENSPLLDAPKNDVASSSVEAKDRQHLHPLFGCCGNIPVLISLELLVLLKSVIEGVSSSAPTVSRYYFGWGVHASGIYLALLASFVLPTSFLVAYISRRFDDRELILGSLVMMFVGILGFMVYSEDGEGYSEVRFIFFGLVAFVSSNALEGPTMGLLSKTIPKSLARGVLNAGLLATEAGTLGRVIGDFWLSSAAFMGLNEMLNRTFEPMCVMVGVSILATLWSYPHLQPRFDDEDDD
eukprot:CAMPEP_0172540916 /NCGR_PEP_ID=MMETSP1067-20121228/11820_1 /TAXON_ID=265564 ORGANISM="Thalassiosira punctigera, Strain Tpunct2005C2" /NCGR_SAMPLE_ID=MMETSP1067 /ASSEMBLY_ACC=CAM_ASM_000444 /LENGTH=900 /DNA_ID=CAMNT_0013326849 /DNA_START=131 /DNA_END=2833 /DNA_ORIENTATION=+